MQEAGFGAELGLGHSPALIVIDMAMAYFTPGSPLHGPYAAMLERTIALVSAFRAVPLPIVFTDMRYDHPADGGLFRRKIPALSVFEAGSPLAALHPRLQPTPADIRLTKHFPSAFFGTPLAATLAALRIDTLILCGLSTSGCIRATALDALCHGFAPVIAADCTGDRSPAIQEANLFDLAAKTADIMNSEDLIRRL